ncbi:MAG: acetylornithine deacetylase [Bacteroidetes bacterium QH_2_63_10]|nr:MAG: acetylornithine deacetylase [Bacteroidetes bacterium QH_2_63_10]
MPPLSVKRDRLIGQLTDLVSINSVNPELVPEGAGEADIAVYVANTMDEMGLEVEVWEPEPGRPNVVGVLPGTGDGRSLMLNAHTDTVGGEGMNAPFNPRITNGQMYGRGTQDMKGSLAAQLAAVRALQAANVERAGDVIVAAVIDEEHKSRGTEAVVNRYDPDGAIVTEPTDLELVLSHKGFVWIDVETRGRAAHGSRPDEGIDANMHMGRVLARLDKLEQSLRTQDGHPIVGAPSLHAARIEGGTSSSVYAARCRLRVERRTVPGETASQAVEEVQTLLDALAAEDSQFDASCQYTFSRRPFEAAPGASIAEAVRATGGDVLGQPPPDAGQTFWTDAALLQAAGTETVVLGPVGGGLHTTEEWVDLDSVVHLANILARTAQQYCT